MKRVHDILQVIVGKPRSPLEPWARPSLNPAPAPIPFAIIQWGKPGEFEYEIICPFCAESIGWYAPEGDYTYGALCINGGGLMAIHRPSCTRFGEDRLEVQLTDRSLNTEVKPHG